MKYSTLFIVSFVVVSLFSFAYATRPAKRSVTIKDVPLAMCSPTARDIEALPEFVSTPTYQLAFAEPLHIRKNVSSLKVTDPILIAFKKGIVEMKKRPASDPTSWTYQAAIHGTTAQPALPAWNSCVHGTQFFLSWHRMYLYFFERILRKASGDKNFALPYWDWSQTDGYNLPATFISPKSEALNPLFQASRDPTMNIGGVIAKAIVKNNLTDAMLSRSMLMPDSRGFPSFNAALEKVHGQIHIAVGGSEGLMRALKTAAQDPIFWMHHNNIDHLWEKWMRQNNPQLPSANDPWMKEKFVFFDENGKKVTMSGKDVVNVAQQLKYKYDDIDIKSDTGNDFGPVFGIEAPPEMPTTLATSNDVQLSADKNVFILSPTPEASTAKLAYGRFMLTFEKIKLKGWANGSFELYLNQDINETPDSDNSNYIGSVDFFGLTDNEASSETHNVKAKNQIFDATTALRAYLSKNPKLGDLRVTIYHRLPEVNGVSQPQKLAVQASVGAVRLEKR